MLLYACMWSDGSLLEELDDVPVVFRTKKAAQEYARQHFDDSSGRKERPKVVSAIVNFSAK